MTETFHRQQVLAKSIANNLKSTNVKTPDFYITPKVHKKDIPGRSAVSSIDCHTSKLYKFVDHYLQPQTKFYHSTLKAPQISKTISKMSIIHQKTLS